MGKLRGSSVLLRCLDLSHNTPCLRLTKPETFAEAVTGLECVSLKMNDLSGAQVTDWSTLIGREPSRLCSDWLVHGVADASSLMP